VGSYCGNEGNIIIENDSYLWVADDLEVSRRPVITESFSKMSRSEKLLHMTRSQWDLNDFFLCNISSFPPYRTRSIAEHQLIIDKIAEKRCGGCAYPDGSTYLNFHLIDPKNVYQFIRSNIKNRLESQWFMHGLILYYSLNNDLLL